MPEFLVLRLEGPLQAWGDVALDPRRPTLPFPTRSGVAGLLANALGWRYRDAARLTALQDALWFAVREDRAPRVIEDFQTVDLNASGTGWTAWGPEKGGDDTHILAKFYLADACFTLALTLRAAAPVSLEELAAALASPARPLYLGRKCCPPAGPILQPARISAADPRQAIGQLPPLDHRWRCWHEVPHSALGTREVWDRRDFASNRFAGARYVAEEWIAPEVAP
ncbi:MAG: type I-E CRISPR-associated protein Cas5/CasD [Fimbriimonadaceae bacterium]|nr:type I-E CRISPR-associated protein Cas5/CasD [Fimbriimonadaceae bacterium]